MFIEKWISGKLIHLKIHIGFLTVFVGLWKWGILTPRITLHTKADASRSIWYKKYWNMNTWKFLEKIIWFNNNNAVIISFVHCARHCTSIAWSDTLIQSALSDVDIFSQLFWFQHRILLPGEIFTEWVWKSLSLRTPTVYTKDTSFQSKYLENL